MFGLFKRKSQKEKLSDLYRKKKELAFKVSKTNRKESDKLEKEANDILIEIDKLKEDQWKFNSMKKLLLLLIIPFLSFGQDLTYVPDDGFEYWIENNIDGASNGDINDNCGWC